jgi:hypothetical protein
MLSITVYHKYNRKKERFRLRGIFEYVTMTTISSQDAIAFFHRTQTAA